MLSAIFSEKTAVLVLTVVGMAMCTAGIGQVAARGDWAHPLSVVGFLLGALILLIAVAGVFELRLPLIDSPRAALIAIVVIAIAKVALTQLHTRLA